MRKVKTVAVVLIMLMSLVAYFRHMNPAMYPPSHFAVRVANTMDRHVDAMEELTPDNHAMLTDYTDTLVAVVKSSELHQRRANRPFAFVLAGLCLISLLYLVEVHKNKHDQTPSAAEETTPNA